MKQLDASLKPKSNRTWKIFKSQLTLQMMILPCMLFLLIFAYIPLAGNIIAFQDFKIISGFTGSEFVGLSNFQEMFSDPTFYMAMKNTVILSLFYLLVVFPAPLLFALLINEIPFVRFRKILQTTSYLPHFISFAMVASMWIILLDSQGVVNQSLLTLQLIQHPIEFWTDPDLFRPLSLLVSIWKETGWGAIIFLAAVAGINPDLYEAAMMDGAGRIKRIIHITLPNLIPLFAILFILKIGTLFTGNLDHSILLGNSFNKESSYVIEYYSLQMGLELTRYSYATAVSLFQAVMSLLLVLFANWFSGKVSGNRLF
ncbi:ABC transporter permease [Paenibacillus radicis (ex Gao et al. 2016)]|uniref:Sugar ABC transporter permease n=1 Tax=Paenibacillus radicis (ex Gao et al. 2016) TaxID=1737354 RepID=A0A917GQ20_9BACL|nr:ABC transporter permease subunit [Paenibacillus radicis (ex Gao et al. 2016)]GGG53510.1 sugar ABC transporter permease [Paenibacillus radicis (ex Gao et al. 2016)]